MNALLYFVVLLAWGSSWFAISFQLGDVAPQVSIVWRFLLASIILFTWCYLRGLKLSFPWRDHLSWFLLGFFLFCVNYICAYFGTFYLASGLVCLIFSTLTLFTVLWFYPWLATNSASRWFHESILSIENAVIFGFIFKIIGFFFILSLIFKMVGSISFLLNGGKAPNSNNDNDNAIGNDSNRTDFDDYEEVN